IIMSTLSQQGSSVAMEALHKGAVDVMPKPSGQEELASFAPVLIEKVKAAAISRKRKTAATMAPHALAQRVPLAAGRTYGARQLILIGASTGGTEAIKEVMQSLPGNLPGIAIVQHIPPHFSAAFANRLNTLCAMEVREAVSGDILKPGLALVAPGGYHMTVRWTTNHYRVDLNQEEPIWHQRPAVDALFFSAAPYVGRDSAACILTGMGRDGAEGLLELRKRGVRTFSQDERSSVVYGMPKVAWELGGSEKQVPLAAMARTLVQSISRSPSSRPTAAPMAT
ncbi:MAG: chemotaxis protein CheB, partial [Verrucomicrobiota bacterium]